MSCMLFNWIISSNWMPFFYVLQRECKMEGRPIISYAGDRKIFQRLESGGITEIMIYALPIY